MRELLVVTLSVRSDSAKSVDQLTTTLGLAPDHHWSKGDEILPRRSGGPRFRRYNNWGVRERAHQEDPDDYILEVIDRLIARLKPHIAGFERLPRGGTVVLFIALTTSDDQFHLAMRNDQVRFFAHLNAEIVVSIVVKNGPPTDE